MTIAYAVPTLTATDPESAATALRGRGLRLSAARRLMIEALFAAREPLSAAALAEQVAGAGVDVASVYRNLERFEQCGLVRHVHLGHGPGLYALSDRVESEYLRCERCDAVRTVRPSALADVRDAIRAATGFEARFSHFPIVGICADCRAAESEAIPQRAKGT